MTVAELIEELKEYPSNARIIVYSGNDCLVDDVVTDKGIYYRDEVGFFEKRVEDPEDFEEVECVLIW